jgi:PAS domain-containing protein
MNGKGNCQRFEPGMIKQSRQQFGFTQGELLKEIPGACFICHADDAHILYANDELIELLECENYEDFNRFTLGLFQNMVYPDDYNRVMAVRNEKLAYAGEGETVSCRFRIITKKGHTRNMVAHARHKHHDLFGELLFVMSLDVDAE